MSDPVQTPNTSEGVAVDSPAEGRITRPTREEQDSAQRSRKEIRELQLQLQDNLRQNVIDRMGVNGLRANDTWRQIASPEVRAEIEKKLKEYGLDDPRLRNEKIEELWQAFKNNKYSSDPAKLKEMADLANKLGEIATLVRSTPAPAAPASNGSAAPAAAQTGIYEASLCSGTAGSTTQLPPQEVLAGLKVKLDQGQMNAATTLITIAQEYGIHDPIILRGMIAYVYRESGLNANCAVINSQEKSIGFFQLGPEVGICNRNDTDPRKQFEALMRRGLDRRIQTKLGDPYYAKDANGFETFMRWYNDNPNASPDEVAQRFGRYLNPSTRTLNGGRPYAETYVALFGRDVNSASTA